MAAEVRFPLPFRSLTQGKAVVEAEGKTLWEVIETLEGDFPGIKAKLCDENGSLKKNINIYINRQDIRYLNGKESGVRDGDQIILLMAVSGG